MKTEKIRCMGLPDGIPVPQFESITEAKAHVKGDETKLVDVLNKYGRQKDSLVNARDWLSEQVDAFFKRMKKDGKTLPDAKTEDSELETESNHINRFVAAALNGGTKAPGLAVTGKDEKEKDASVWQYLQGIVDKSGKDWPFDLNATQRVGKAKKLPVHAVNGARTIIANKSEAKWVKNFTEGFDFDGIKLEPIAFAPFTTPVAKGASEEDAKKVREENEQNLARAIAAAFEQRNAKAAAAKFV